MKVMILAAGRGKRMGELTENTPKPLLRVGHYPLIGWQLLRLARAGIQEVVINLGYLGEQIEQTLGDGQDYGVRIRYSREPQEGLETAGGIVQALPMLGDGHFLVVNADVWCEVDFAHFIRNWPSDSDTLAHLLLVDTPDWKSRGDFGLSGENVIAGNHYTFSGVSILHSRLFAGLAAGVQPLAPLLHRAIQTGQVSGEYYSGLWQDVGTPERLAGLRARYS